MGRTKTTQQELEKIAPVQPGAEPEQAVEKESESAAAEQQPQNDRALIEAVKTYKDLELGRIVKKGERLPMKYDRAAVIIEKGLGEYVKE